MRKLISGAYFNPRDAREQRYRMAIRGEKPVGEPDDLRDYSKAWDRAADGLIRQDPAGTMLRELFDSIDEDAKRNKSQTKTKSRKV